MTGLNLGFTMPDIAQSNLSLSLALSLSLSFSFDVSREDGDLLESLIMWTSSGFV